MKKLKRKKPAWKVRNKKCGIEENERQEEEEEEEEKVFLLLRVTNEVVISVKVSAVLKSEVGTIAGASATTTATVTITATTATTPTTATDAAN
uniref:Uncharacterized protein n=1 Tax=Syphacia muris TaxID=451379 RepID=A0A0N5AFS1_9BILA